MNNNEIAIESGITILNDHMNITQNCQMSNKWRLLIFFYKFIFFLVVHSKNFLFVFFLVMCGHQPQQQSSPYREEDSGEFTVPSSLWTSASLENIILNLTKKYCTLDSMSHYYGTHEDLPSLGMQQDREQVFASQEDLRFAGQLDNHLNDYNHSAFPSTDGMDKVTNHSKSFGRFTAQESCPSLPRLLKDRDVLSKSTQSAGNVRRLRNRGSFGRMYGSTPNLKVSKYETAFGPDNRTVTRVFYQNGFTTDVSHDDEDDNDDVFPSLQGNKLADKKISAECMYVYDAEPNIGNSEDKSSTIGIDCVQSRRPNQQKSYNYSNCDRNRISCPDYPTAYRTSYKTSSSPDKMNLSFGQTITLPLSQEPCLHNSSQASIRSAPETPGSALKGNDQFPKHFDDETYGQKINTTRQPSHAVKSVVTSPTLFYPTEEKMTPVQQRSQSCLLKEMYGPGYRPPTRSWARSKSQLEIPGATRASTSSLQSIVSGNIGRNRRDPILLFDEQNYRPVLDASKEKKFVSSSASSLLEKTHLPEDTGDQNYNDQLNSSRNCLTSTPMFASLNNTNFPHLSGDSCPPSRIPSHLSTQKKGLNTTRSGKITNCKFHIQDG